MTSDSMTAADSDLLAAAAGISLAAAAAAIETGGSLQAAVHLLDTPLAVRAAIEIGRRVAVRPLPAETADSPQAVFNLFRDYAIAEVENFGVAALDVHNRVVGRFTLARGSSNGVHIDMAAVLRTVLRVGVSRAIIVHNHPSGDPAPSPEDDALTRRLWEGFRKVGIVLVDHVIVTTRGLYSYSFTLRAYEADAAE